MEGVKTFKPGYPDKITKQYAEMPNISYVSGPNQHGKSNLLNMFALAFHGLEENANVNDSLLSDIEKRISSEKIKGLTFEIVICDKDGGPLVKSVKEEAASPEIETYEYIENSWRILPSTTFQQKYNLL